MPGEARSNAPWPKGFPSDDYVRSSRGLEQFLFALEPKRNSGVLDLGGASQANISFITGLGHRISSENLLEGVDQIWHDDSTSEAGKIEGFLDQVMNYQYSSFAGVFVWDALQFLPQPLLQAAINRLHDVLEKDGVLLAYFLADEKLTTVPTYTHRVMDNKSILLSPRSLRTRNQFLNSRAIENLFQNYKTIKFFLTKDHLREVLVVR